MGLLLLVPALAARALIPSNPDPQEAAKQALEEKEIETAHVNQHVALLADAILATEGRCGHGGSGERGCFQYLPSTWRAYSIEVTGEVLPLTVENERMVTEGMIRSWKADGMTDRGVFLTWNQGSATGWGGGTDCYSGINKYGVPYDSCDYAARGLKYVAENS